LVAFEHGIEVREHLAEVAIKVGITAQMLRRWVRRPHKLGDVLIDEH